MSLRKSLLTATALTCATAFGASAQTTVTIATVNNGDMVRMQGLADDFTAANPDITLEWVTLEEMSGLPVTESTHAFAKRIALARL